MPFIYFPAQGINALFWLILFHETSMAWFVIEAHRSMTTLNPTVKAVSPIINIMKQVLLHLTLEHIV